MPPRSSQGVGMTSRRTRERLLARLREQGIRDERVLAAIRDVPRHLFMDEALGSRAYEDTALPIGHGQTISQPFIVAQMTALVLRVAPKRILEIGTGSGYQAAVLARLVEQVYTIERIGHLFQAARRRFSELGLANVTTRLGDGQGGWPDRSPFDAIVVTCAHPDVPAPLIQQLRVGGCLIMPVGGKEQTLDVIRREEGGMVVERLQPVSFVPLLTGVE